MQETTLMSITSSLHSHLYISNYTRTFLDKCYEVLRIDARLICSNTSNGEARRNFTRRKTSKNGTEKVLR